MPGQDERWLQQEIVKRLKKMGPEVWWLKVHGGPYQRSGVPDLLICFWGRFVAVELKKPGEKLEATPAQKHELGRIAAANGLAAVVNSIEGWDEVVATARQLAGLPVSE